MRTSSLFRLARVIPEPAHALIACLAAGVLCFSLGCRDGETPTAPVYADDGMWIEDSTFTVDEFPFQTAACTEVFPDGSSSADSIPGNTVADLRVISTACYHARVRVVNADSDTVRTFETRFGIFNRSDNEKNRGVVGFLAWDGRDDKGTLSPPGIYLWRMEFDFGAGRIRKFRAEMDIR